MRALQVAAVSAWVTSLGLRGAGGEKVAWGFRANAVDGPALAELTHGDLKEMGVVIAVGETVILLTSPLHPY